MVIIMRTEERELLVRAKVLLDCVDTAPLQDQADLIVRKITELLAQPEEAPMPPRAPMTQREAYQRGYATARRDYKREPLSYEATSDMFHASKQATMAVCYWAGVCDAEKAHGIGVDDE